MSDEIRLTPRGRRRATGLLAPCAIVFFSGFCIMLIELVASQLVSGYIGRSLETWTAVIGVILAGITAGNYLGGIMADRFRSKQLAATLFILSAVLSLSILFLVDPVGRATAAFGYDGSANLKRILAVTFGVFFLPATVLGMISPAIVKWALDFGYATGSTVGTVYAWNTIGSILGTFITGYYLIGWFNVQTIVIVAAGGLLLAGLSFIPSILAGGGGLGVDDAARTRVSPANSRSEWGREGLIVPSAIVFASGFCVMLVEIVAGRLVAGHIGQSIYTWTSVIGVILAGITAGNYAGGKLADRFEAKALVGSLLLIASIFVLTLLFSHLVIPNANEHWPTSFFSWGNRVALVCMAAFFLPSAALGMISPAVAKWALERKYASGQTVGTIYAWNTIGSIAGTFATGFFLISMFYVNRLIAFSSLGLALLALLFLLTGGTMVSRLAGLGWAAIVLLAVGFCCVPATRFEDTVLAFPRPTAGTLPRERAHKFLEQLEFIKESLASVDKKCAAAKAPALKDAEFGAWLRERQKPLVEGFLPQFEAALHDAKERALLDKIKQVERDAGFTVDALKNDASTKTPARLDPESARRQIKELRDALDAIHAEHGSSVPFDAIRFETALYDLRQGMRGLMAVARKAGDEAVEVVKEDVDDVQGRIGTLLNNASSRERSWLRFAAKAFGRVEEINLDDQYDADDMLQYYDESNYFTLQVSERKEESKRLNDYELDEKGQPKLDENGKKTLRERKFRQLVLDALIHGYVDLSDYSYLHYEYEHIYATVSHRLMVKHRKAGQKLRVLFLGGGSYTFPRYLTALYPKDAKNEVIACDIAEIDPRVTATVRKSMGMNQLKGKRILLLTDERAAFSPVRPYGELHRTTLPSYWNGLKSLASNVASRQLTPEEKREYYIRTINEAGAELARSPNADRGKPVDFVIDIRENPAAETNDSKAATAAKIPILDPATFHRMIDTSPFDNIVTHHMDARQYILQNKDKGQYDVVYGDAFNDFSVPSHLTTLEFNQKMAELLKDDGIFMANVIDKWQVSKFMGAYLNTLEKVFKHVYLLKDRTGDPGKSRDTFVIVCSNKPVDLDDLGERDEDVKGMVGDVMSPRLMKPVRRGGLFPPKWLGVFDDSKVEFDCDGSKAEFDLGMQVGEAAVSVKHRLEPNEYTLKDARRKSPEQMLRLSAPLPKDGKLLVRLRLSTSRLTLEGDDEIWKKGLPQYDVKVEYRPPGAKEPAKTLPFAVDAQDADSIELSFVDTAAEQQKASAKATKKSDATTRDDLPRAAVSQASTVVVGLTAEPQVVEFTGDDKTSAFALPLPKLAIDWERLLDDRDLAVLDVPTNEKDKAEWNQTEAENARKIHSVAWRGPLYEIRDGRYLKFKEPPPAGYKVVVRRYTENKIVLTDRYCPVDIMLAEVAATRQRDQDE